MAMPTPAIAFKTATFYKGKLVRKIKNRAFHHPNLTLLGINYKINPTQSIYNPIKV